jgi:signal transduction histidine kinase
MRKFFKEIWPDFSMTADGGGQENYQEFLIRVVLIFMWGVILVFTPVVFVVMFSGDVLQPFPTGDVVIILLLNIFGSVSVYYTSKGYWRLFGHLAPLVLLLLGDYGIWFHGIRTSFILIFALVMVLAGMFHNFQRQMLIFIFILANWVGILWYRGYSLDGSLSSLIVASALLLGISLLQSLSSMLLWRFIEHNQALSNDLRQENYLRKEREHEIEEMNRSLDEQVRLRTAQLADKHKELSDLSYSLAHDLRAPLRAVIGFNQIVINENQTDLGEDSLDLLQRSIEAGQRMDQLIESILSLSRIGQSQMVYEHFHIGEVVESTFQEIKCAKAVENAELVIHDCPVVYADKDLTLMMVRNLVSNAIKFSIGKEPFTIEFGCRSEEGEKTVYYLRDNGIGFSMAYAEKVFEPFHRLVEDESVEGIGIGLSIVKRVVERHRGNIWAESEPGEGAVFYFSL